MICLTQGEAYTLGESALYIRRWLSEEEGERPSIEQEVCWRDLKRNYLEMSPSLRYVYLAVKDPQPYSDTLVILGFELLPEQESLIGDSAYYSAILDLGTGSTAGWVEWLLKSELCILPDMSINALQRELCLGDGTVHPLTKRECGVMSLLLENEGETISREDILDAVWGIEYEGGSNVVDVIIKALRKKSGVYSKCIRAVWGVGYRVDI